LSYEAGQLGLGDFPVVPHKHSWSVFSLAPRRTSDGDLLIRPRHLNKLSYCY